MDVIRAKKNLELKRVSINQGLMSMLPPQPPRRKMNRIIRHSKLDSLPLIDLKKSTRSVPTTLELAIHREGKRDSKDLCIPEGLSRWGSEANYASLRRVAFDR
jgi:hypothetical protein